MNPETHADSGLGDADRALADDLDAACDLDAARTAAQFAPSLAQALRRSRRRRRLSQRDFAVQLGTSPATLGRLEMGQLPQAVLALLRVVQHAGLEVVLVDQETSGRLDVGPPSAHTNAAGRRFPAHAEERSIRFPHHWWFVRHPQATRKDWPEWTWRRSSTYIGKLCKIAGMPSAAIAASSPSAALGPELLAVVARLNRMATRQAGLPVPYAQARLLAQIEDRAPARISELAAADHCSQPTMTTQVQRLEAGGWVARRPDPADARAVLVSMTARGSQVLREVRERRAAVVAPYLEGLDPAERQTLVAAVDVLRRVLAEAGATHTSSTHTSAR
jgi:DNA-binding MarR family transcriptional regulator/DNA-binding transcriptional regulator YiaG